MSKKWWTIGSVAGGMCIGAAIVVMVLMSKNHSVQKPKSTSTATLRVQHVTKPPETLLTYADASGFSFQYPSSLTVSDETPKDTSYYSLLALKDASGAKMAVTIRDTTAKTVDEWFSGQGLSASRMNVKFGTLDAQQYQGNGKLVTVAVDQGVAYMIESLSDNGSWAQAHTKIATSFSFSNPSAATKAASSSPASANASVSGASSGDTIYDTEEVVE